VLHTVFPVCAEEIEPQTVLLLVHHPDKLAPQARPLGWIYDALEDRKLDSLAPVLTDLRNAPQAPPTGRILGVHVVTHQKIGTDTIIVTIRGVYDHDRACHGLAEPLHPAIRIM
jgi:hypothetical protein